MGHLYNELNPYCAAVLRARIAEGRLPHGVVDERDITTIPDQDFLGFDHVHLFAGIGGFPLGMSLAGFPEGLRVVTGGFPCQDISNAGKRAGITGARSGLWREMARCIRVVRPDIVLVENVAALLGRGISTVLGDLAEIGYDAKWNCVSAADAGAPHLRERIWIMAYPFGQQANSKRLGPFGVNEFGRHTMGTGEKAVQQENGAAGHDDAGRYDSRKAVAYPSGERCGEAWPDSQRPEIRTSSGSDVLADASRELLNGSGPPANSCGEIPDSECGDGQRVLAGCADANLGQEQGERSIGLQDRGRRKEWTPEPNVGRVVYGIPRPMDGAK
jgi:DNA (cytosine-5)-methyltransferase 1